MSHDLNANVLPILQHEIPEALEVDGGIQKFKSLPNSALIDVRSKKEFLQNHIPLSVNIPESEIDEVIQFFPSKDTNMFLYCNTGVRVKRAYCRLLQLGYRNIYIMEGIQKMPSPLLKSNVDFSNWPVWQSLSGDEQDLVKTRFYSRTIFKGEIIDCLSDHCLGIFFIKSGEMRAFLLSENGKEITLFELNEWKTCVLCASCALPEINFDVHLRAEQDTEIVVLDSSVVASLLETNVFMRCYLYEQLAHHFSNVVTSVKQTMFDSLECRIACFLKNEYMKNQNVNINVTHEQIAHQINASRENVTRILKRFSDLGFIRLGRGKITLLNISELNNI